ncbi:response regulator [Halorubrum laminariae]|uniref:Response regulator n=1 Tax=Halorubrum laminariae TaxID=1433523 RepID=A0ABD6C628_9EURY|nr:response regulator [Halorubrum laminariae]
MLGRVRTDTTIRVIHVEDDSAFADLTASYLDRLDPRFEHQSTRTIADAKRRFEAGPVDAVVSDYDLPDGTGIDFLEDVRETDPELPFVLFTGKGSEEVASEAISAGVTDYLQKRGSTDQYEVLINRIRNAVDHHRLSEHVERSVAALEAASEPIAILDSDGTYLFANDPYASVYGVEVGELVGTHWEEFYPDDEIERFSHTVLPSVSDDGHWTGEATVETPDGCRIREQLSLTHTTDGGHVCIIRGTEQIRES